MKLEQRDAVQRDPNTEGVTRVYLTKNDRSKPSWANDDHEPFDRAVERHAGSLRAMLERCVALAGSPNSVRETDLIRLLQLDRSVLGRVVRSLHASTPFEFLHEIPSPDGLSLVLDAAVDKGHVSGREQRSARESIARYRRFLNGYPGKRRAVLLRLAASMPSQRAAADLVSRRAMTRAASDLLGYRVRCTVAAMIVFDGGDRDRFDTIHMFGKYGLERTRPDGAPIIVGSLRTGPEGPVCPYVPADPGGDPNDATSALLLDYCQGAAHVEFIRSSLGQTELQLPSDEPALHEPIDVVCAQRGPGVLLRYQREGFTHEWHQVITRMPTDRVVIDLVLGPGVYPGVVPMISQQMYRPDPPKLPTPGTRLADEVRPYAAVDDLGLGLGSVHIESVPRYAECLRSLVGHTGLRADQCRVIRVAKDHPELNSGLICWFPLSEPDRSSSEQI
ncbi:MAG: hypothetical protein AAGH71_06445 [Planctomycetota bacterium]